MKRVGQGLAFVLSGITILVVMRWLMLVPDGPSSDPVSRSGVARESAAASVVIAPVNAPAATKPTGPQSVSAVAHQLPIVTQAWTPRPKYSNAALALAALRPRAEAGDTKAMIGIALALAACRERRPTEEEVDTVQRTSIDAGLGKLVEDEDIEALKESNSEFQAYCPLSRSEIFAEYNRWLRTAADAGDSEALLLAARLPPLDLAESDRRFERMLHGGPLTSMLTDEDTALARQRAEAAIAAGEIEGLNVAGVLGENTIDRYVYSALLFNVDRENGKPQKSSWGVEHYGSALKAADIAIAEQRIANTMASVPIWIRRPPFPALEIAAPPPPSR